jgi:hypothetical protein
VRINGDPGVLVTPSKEEVRLEMLYLREVYHPG